MRTGERRCREVHGDVQHVQADEAVLHHRGVQRSRVASVELVQQRDALVGGGEEGAGAAGEVPDLQRRDAVLVAPFCAAGRVVSGNGESGQQRGGGRSGVEGGEEFAVGDQALEDHAGQIVGLGHAALDQSQRSLAQRREQIRGGFLGQLADDF